MSVPWPKVQLKELLTPVSRPAKVQAGETYRLLGARWYAGGLFIKDTRDGSEIRADKVYRVERGDFVYNRLFAWKGSFAIADDATHGCYVSNEFPCFHSHSEKVEPRYLQRYMSREKAWAEALGLSSGGTPTSRNRLKEEKLLGMSIPLPPLAEQQRIVARIDKLAAQINEAQGVRQQAAREAQALFEASVGAKFANLEIHTKKRLSTLTTKIGSGSTPQGGRSAYPTSGIPFIRSLNVRMRQFQWDGIAFISPETHEQMSGTHIQPRDVLLNITGASIGRVACVPDDVAAANVNQHVAIIRPTKEIEAQYLMYWLSQPAVQDVINAEQKGATRQGFTKSQIESFEVPVPTPVEQRRIIADLDGLQAEVNSLKRLQAETTAELDALLPSILDKAFKGELLR